MNPEVVYIDNLESHYLSLDVKMIILVEIIVKFVQLVVHLKESDVGRYAVTQPHLYDITRHQLSG